MRDFSSKQIQQDKIRKFYYMEAIGWGDALSEGGEWIIRVTTDNDCLDSYRMENLNLHDCSQGYIKENEQLNVISH